MGPFMRLTLLLKSACLLTILLLSFSRSNYAIAANTLSSIPPVSQLVYRGYVRPNGDLLVQEVITFPNTLTAETFMWKIPSSAKEVTISLKSSQPEPAKIISVDHSSKLISPKQAGNDSRFTIMYTISNTTGFYKEATTHWQLLSEPVSPIQRVSISLSLPYPSAENAIDARLFGTNDIRTSPIQIQNGQIIHTSFNVASPSSFAALYVRWPNKVTLPPFQLFISELSDANLTGLFWIVAAFPLLTLLGLLVFSILLTAVEFVCPFPKPRTSPPSSLPPAVVSVLLHKQVSPPALLATLFSLAERGYLDTFAKDKKFVFGKRRQSDQNVAHWEKIVFEQIFPPDNFQVEKQMLEKNLRTKLFSRPVACVYNSLYEQAEKLDFFTRDPYEMRIRYKLLGLIVYYFGLLGFIYLLTTSQPFILLLPALGIILSALLIIRFAPQFIRRTANGKTTLKDWIAFRRYLTDTKPIINTDSTNGLFVKYMPYAIVFGVERQWAARFKKSAIMKPDWLYSYGKDSTEFSSQRFVEALGQIAKSFEAIHGPIVE